MTSLKRNAMLNHRYELYYEWDFEKNDNIDIYSVAQGSHRVVWWICPKCNSSYDMIVNKRSKGADCPYCCGSRVNHTNSLYSTNLPIINEWNYQLNNELTPHNVTKYSRLKVWWSCEKCGSNYDSKILERVKGQNCPYCAGKRVNHTNSLATSNPILSLEWNYIKNENKSPHLVSEFTSQKVWWVCDNGHEWEASISNRSKGRGCPYCANKKVLVGYNDMWTTNPELAKLLLNPEDGYKYMQNSGHKTDWKCACGNIIKNKVIVSVNKQGLFCPLCADNFSFPEKLMYNLLVQLKINFNFQESFMWLKSRSYDFYIPSLNIIIETHGRQHYKSGFDTIGGRSLEEEQENDKYKYKLAIQNGILPENYIVIDCRKSDFDFIKSNIMSSRLAEIFDLREVDWNEIYLHSTKSLIFTVSDLKSKGLSTAQIMSETKLSRTTVIKYLKTGNALGLCKYDAKQEMINTSYRQGKNNNKTILQFSLDDVFIKEWNSGVEASEALGISKFNISSVCTGKRNHAGGYKWRHKNIQQES